MSNSIGKQILHYKDEILEDVVRAVRIPSVRGDAKPGMPFGEGPTEALRFCLNLAESFGFKVKNVGNVAGHIEYGEGEKLVGILAHVDVVPAGEGWRYQPFGGEVRDGRIYGRGTMDDKGPAVAAIYCLKALRDLGVKPKARIRVILGAGEETGTEDMDEYFSREDMPDYAFSPDGDYPICNREKGILYLSLSGRNNGKIRSFEAGNAANIVPLSAQAVVEGGPDTVRKIEQAVMNNKNSEVKFAILPQDNGEITVRCFGKSAHASTPEQGVNAAAYLIRILCDALGNNAGEFVNYINDSIGLEYNGKAVGAGCEDAESGPLTLNLGIVRCDGAKAESVIDIRYPVTKNGGEIAGPILEHAKTHGIEAAVKSDSKPLMVDPDSELIEKLRSAYKTATKEEPRLYSTGGGSYARSLENRGVAFGAGVRPCSFYNIHGADEFLDIEDFMKHCQICLQAMYELGCC